MARVWEATIGIVVLIIGGAIYVLYRNEHLLMFDWFQYLGISDYINRLRAEANGLSLYEWVKYSMPAGLWLFSYMFIIDSIWGKGSNALYKSFLYVLPVLAILSELMQCIKILPGTFDIMDLISYVLAIIVFLIIK